MIKENRILKRCFANGRLWGMRFSLGLAAASLAGCESRDSGLVRVISEESGTEEEDSGIPTVSANEVSEEGYGDGAEETEIKTVDQVAIYVHICGAVKNPGVYEFDPGDRIFNAVEKAGGFTEDASEDYVNLALQLTDGSRIEIPTKEEAEQLEETGDTSQTAGTVRTAGVEVPQTSQETQGTDENGLVNINTADAQTLMGLSGIGETRAAAILAYRDVHGGFETKEDIKNVSGIGDSTYEKIKDRITTGR